MPFLFLLYSIYSSLQYINNDFLTPLVALLQGSEQTIKYEDINNQTISEQNITKIPETGSENKKKMTERESKFSTQKSRMDSFISPADKFIQSPYIEYHKEALAKAGFVKAWRNEHPDIVQCIKCYGLFKNWNEHSDIRAEHIRFEPECPHMHRMIFDCLKSLNNNEGSPPHSVREIIVNWFMNSPDTAENLIHHMKVCKSVVIGQYHNTDSDYFEEAVLFCFIKYMASRYFKFSEKVLKGLCFEKSEALDENAADKLNKIINNISYVLEKLQPADFCPNTQNMNIINRETKNESDFLDIEIIHDVS